MRIILIICAALVLSQCDKDEPRVQPDPPVPMEFGLTERPDNTSCLAPNRPGNPINTLSLSNAFPASANMSGLLDLQRGPADFPSWWGIKQNGQVWVLADGQASAQMVMDANDLSSLTTGGEQGLLGLAIDPYFPNNQNVENSNIVRIFLYYTSSNCAANGLCTRVSRFTFSHNNGQFTLRNRLDNLSIEDQLMIVQQPATNHNGGALRIGPDNHLYITMGDGGHGNDPACAGLNLHTPLGKLLRIDINTLSGYTIPTANPYSTIPQKCDRFATVASIDLNNRANSVPDDGYGSNCPEIIAYGLRNPFRISFDQDTGFVWIGDVGQNAVEEISKLDSSNLTNNNFGWPLREGPDSVNNSVCSKLASVNQNFVDPVYYYRHTANSHAIVGGVVYRGLELGDQYRGKYIFSEVYTGEIWLQDQPYATNNQNVTGLALNDISLGIYGFTQDENGEIYLLTIGGIPQKLQLSNNTVDDFPQTLRQTGCFDGQDPSRPNETMIPYTVNAPLWSDHAVKERYFAIPNGSTVTVDANGDLNFPTGSVLAKVFRTPQGDLLETRLLVHHQDGWAGYAYAWNQAGTQATLVSGETLIPQHNWTIPSRTQCLQCHTDAAGVSLGLEVAQLNGDFHYRQTNYIANQLATLSHIGVLQDPIDPNQQPQLVSMQDNNIEWATRSYLHSNCSHCHRPNGGSNSPMDLRYWTSLTDSGLCNAPSDPTQWPNGTLLVKPGLAAESLIWMRTTSLQDRMPPIGSQVVDDAGTGLIEAWINSLGSCP